MRPFSTETAPPKRSIWKRLVAASVALEFGYMGVLYLASQEGDFGQWMRNNIPTINESLHAVNEIKNLSDSAFLSIKDVSEASSRKMDEFKKGFDEVRKSFSQKLSSVTGFFKKTGENSEASKTIIPNVKEMANEVSIVNNVSDDHDLDAVVKMMAEMETWKDYERKILYEEVAKKFSEEEEVKFASRLQDFENSLRKKVYLEMIWQMEQEKKGKLAKLNLLDSKLKALQVELMDNNHCAFDRLNLLKLNSLLELIHYKVNNGESVRFELKQLETIAGRLGKFENKFLEFLPLLAQDPQSSSAEKLQETFYSLAPEIQRAAFLTNNIFSHVVSPVLDYLSSDLPSKLVKGETNNDRISRAKFFMKKGQIEYAVREAAQLDGWAAICAKPWIEEARKYLVLQMATSALQSEVRLLSMHQIN